MTDAVVQARENAESSQLRTGNNAAIHSAVHEAWGPQGTQFSATEQGRGHQTTLDFGNVDDLYGAGNNKILLADNSTDTAPKPSADESARELHDEHAPKPVHEGAWKIPGKDDNYHGWKPGDKFDPMQFEGWREQVRTYVAEFMKLNNIDPKSPEGEQFRNAFQHELAAASFQKQTGAHGLLVDSIGVGQEMYQFGKDSLGILGATSMIDSAGRWGDEKMLAQGKAELHEYSNRLASMFPYDSINDMCNNHIGASIAKQATSWDELLLKVADSALQAPENHGVGK